MKDVVDMAPEESAPDAPHYWAFISYRHAEVDSKVAAEIQKGLERFWVPKSLRDKTGSSHIAPVFRDKEELPVSARLGDDITAALKGSKALVVICSPRTQESSWVAREIDTFLAYHDQNRVFVVLAEGEPHDVIPKRLLHEGNRSNGIDESHAADIKDDIEPLACDFREANRKERRIELARLAAGVLGVSFDSLMRRAQRRRTRIIGAVAAGVTSIALGIASFALWSNARISENYQMAQMQQSQYLTSSADESLGSGDRLKAIELLSAALPKDEGERPLLPAALRSLVDATESYQKAEIKPWDKDELTSKYNMPNPVFWYDISPNEKYLAAVDDLGLLRVWDLSTSDVIYEATIELSTTQSGNNNGLLMADDGTLVVNEHGGLARHDINVGTSIWHINIAEAFPDEKYTSIAYFPLIAMREDTVTAIGEAGVYLIERKTGKTTKSIAPLPWGGIIPAYIESYDWNGTANRLFLSVCEDVNTSSLHHIDLVTGDVLDISKESKPVSAALLLDNGDSIVCQNEGLLSESVQNHSLIAQYKYLRTITCYDSTNGSARWSTQVDAWEISKSDTFLDLGDNVKGHEGHHLISFCFSNLCVLLDANTGEVLCRIETSGPIAFACYAEPYILGVLSDGTSFTGSFAGLEDAFPNGIARNLPTFYEKPSKFGSYCRSLSDGLMIVNGSVLYRYQNRSTEDNGTKLTSAEVSNCYMQSCHSTNYGTLMVFHPKDYDDPAGIAEIVRMFDPEHNVTLWEHSYLKSDGWLNSYVLNDPTYCSKAILLFSSKDYAKDPGHKIVVLDLADGKETTYEAHTSESLWNGEGCIVNTYTTRPEGNLVAWGKPHPEENALLVYYTDLTEGQTTLTGAKLPKSTQSFQEIDPGDHIAGSADPTGAKFLVPVFYETQDEGQSIEKPPLICAITGKDLGQATMLSLPICRDARLENSLLVDWSDDGKCIACVTPDTIATYSSQGTMLFSIPLDNRKVWSLYIRDNRLLVVANEMGRTCAYSYDMANGSLVSRQVLLENVDNKSFSLSNSSCKWIEATSEKRDPGNLCLLLTPEKKLFLMNDETLEIYQRIDECIGYDDHSRVFIVIEDVDSSVCISYKRKTIDELLERGRELLGTSTMSGSERMVYGLD